MGQEITVITEVLELMTSMVAADGGRVELADWSPERSRLEVDYAKGVNEACMTCVLDADSMKAFIKDGLTTRGLDVTEVVVREAAAV